MRINSKTNLNLLIYFKKICFLCQSLKVSAGEYSEDCIWHVVGATGFEPATARPPGVCATGLRYAPTLLIIMEYAFWKRVKFFEQSAYQLFLKS